MDYQLWLLKDGKWHLEGFFESPIIAKKHYLEEIGSSSVDNYRITYCQETPVDTF